MDPVINKHRVDDKPSPEENLFDDLDLEKQKKPASLILYFFVSLSYIFFMAADMFFRVDGWRFTVKPFNWQALLALLLLPVLGTILLYRKRRSGWIISLFYKIVILHLILFSLVKVWMMFKFFPLSIRLAALVILPAMSILLLLQKDLKSYVKIDRKVLALTVASAIVVGWALIYLLMILPGKAL